MNIAQHRFEREVRARPTTGAKIEVLAPDLRQIRIVFFFLESESTHARAYREPERQNPEPLGIVQILRSAPNVLPCREPSTHIHLPGAKTLGCFETIEVHRTPHLGNRESIKSLKTSCP